jgi:hypothetical protein
MDCQMTVDHASNSLFPVYGKCGKPAKYKVPHPSMKVEYVCGIHARSLDKLFERTGKTYRCEPLAEVKPEGRAK